MRDVKPAAFLDRDGTINTEKGYLYRIEDFTYLDGAVEGLKRLQMLGYLLVVVTNQSGIARGYYTEEDFCRLTDWMLADLKSKGIQISGVYHCPHYPEGRIPEYRKLCNCRKPKTGMFYQAAGELGIDLDRSIAIGDKIRDLCICQETGVKGFLLSDCEETVEGVISCGSWSELIHRVERMKV